MTSNSPPFDRSQILWELSTADRGRADSLLAFVDRLRYLPNARRTVLDAVEQLSEVCSAVAQAVHDLAQSDGFGGSDPDQDLVDLGLNAYFVSWLYQIATNVNRGAAAGRVALWEEPLERLLASLGVNAKVLVYPIDELNYEAGPLTKELQDIGLRHPDIGELDLEPTIHLLGYPTPDEEDGLHHIILMHEIGHVLRSEIQSFSDDLDDLGFTPEQYALIATADEAMADGLVASLADWIEEVACDVIAVRLTGPAFALAQCEFLRGVDETSVTSESHPPDALRLKLLLSLIASHDDPLSTRLAEWQKWLEQLANGVSDDPRVSRLQEVFADIVDAVKRVVPDEMTYAGADDLELLLQRIERGVPPDQMGFGIDAQPAQLAQMLNSGWLALAKAQGTNTFARLGTDFPAQRRAIAHLTGKAVELAEIAHRWRRANP